MTGLRDESGQTLVLGALCLTVLLGFLGICIDVGHLRYAKTRLQFAADAAALAAGLEMRVCAASNPCPAMAAAGQSSLAENGFTASSVVYNCATPPSGSLSISFNLPPCSLGVVDPNTGKSGFLEVQLQEPVGTLFARVLGWSTFTVSARAEVQHAGGPCIYALDPSGAGAITTVASLTSSCGIVDESSSSSALSCTAGTISAPQIIIAGGSSSLLCSTSTSPRTSAPLPAPSDPFSYLIKPTVPACGSASVGPSYHGSPTPLTLTAGTSTLYPDAAYCGGITIGPLAKVTFTPGVYVLTGPAVTALGLNINLGATVSGSGVTFYNAGPNGGLLLTGTAVVGNTVNLTAQTAGSYRGILYFQAAANSTAGKVLASASTTTLQGGFYLPSAQLSYFAASPGPYTALVAKDLSFINSALTLQSNFSSLTGGSPLNADNVQLVQ